MHLFSYGIDPLLTYLDRRLHGILISSTPVQGQVPFLSLPYEERYKVIGYSDDVKPAITSMKEFTMVDQAMSLFEKASGWRLHRLFRDGWGEALEDREIYTPFSQKLVNEHLLLFKDLV